MFLLPYISIYTVKVCSCLTCTEVPAVNALCSLFLQLSVSPPFPQTQNMAVLCRHADVSMPFTKASDTETQLLKLLQQKENKDSCNFCVFVKEIWNLLKETHCSIKPTIKLSYIYTQITTTSPRYCHLTLLSSVWFQSSTAPLSCQVTVDVRSCEIKRIIPVTKTQRLHDEQPEHKKTTHTTLLIGYLNAMFLRFC